MGRFWGIDLHSKSLVMCALTAEGDIEKRLTIATRREDIIAFAKRELRADDEVAMEAGRNTWAIADLIAGSVAKLVVSNPMRTKAIASAKVKTDKIDAKILAELLRCRFLPEVWQPDEETRRMRRLTNRRASLVGNRTGIKNRLHAELASRLIPVPFATLFSVKGMAWLQETELPDECRRNVDADLRLLEAVQKEISLLETEVAKTAYANQEVKLLMTLPGLGKNGAVALMAAWGDLTRFPDAEHAAAYLGLAPSTRQSGDSCYHGPITKQGARRARWLLVQAAQHLAKHPGPLGHFFRKKQRQKNRNVAVVACARKLAVVGFHMLVHGEPYRYAASLATENKLAALRVQATGKRRKRGPKKGIKLSSNYGTGTKTRMHKSLAEVYALENLPTPLGPDLISAGEKRILERAGAEKHFKMIQSGHRVRRAAQQTKN